MQTIHGQPGFSTRADFETRPQATRNHVECLLSSDPCFHLRLHDLHLWEELLRLRTLDGRVHDHIIAWNL